MIWGLCVKGGVLIAVSSTQNSNDFQIFPSSIMVWICLACFPHLRSVKCYPRPELDRSQTLSFQRKVAGTVDKFCSFRGCISSSSRMSHKVSCLWKTLLGFTNLWHLWRLHKIPLSVKSRLYMAGARTISLRNKVIEAISARVIDGCTQVFSWTS